MINNLLPNIAGEQSHDTAHALLAHLVVSYLYYSPYRMEYLG